MQGRLFPAAEQRYGDDRRGMYPGDARILYERGRRNRRCKALVCGRYDPARGRADGHQRQRGPQPQELPPHRCGGHVPLGHNAELYGRDGCLPDDKGVALPRIWRAGRGKVCRRLQRCGLLLKAVAEGAVERLHPARRGLSL